MIDTNSFVGTEEYIAPEVAMHFTLQMLYVSSSNCKILFFHWQNTLFPKNAKCSSGTCVNA
jgi:hypothetical protein